MRRVVRLSTSAGTGEGRGHLARALSLSEARWPDDVSLEITLERGEPSEAERRRAQAAGARIVEPRETLEQDAVVVVDTPDPTAIAGRHDPGRLVVFDDSERFTGEAALVVQPSMPTWSGAANARRVLAGYRWAPIGSAWQGVTHHALRTDEETRPQLVVCFGGSDPADVTGRLAPALDDDPRWIATIVVGPDYQAALEAGDHVVREPRDLPLRIAAADLVVIGAGTMKFEVAALGRPAILLAVADDQLTVGPAFAATGAARWLGDGRVIDPSVVHDEVARLLSDGSTRTAMAAAGRRAVDGRGADRVAAEAAALGRPRWTRGAG